MVQIFCKVLFKYSQLTPVQLGCLSTLTVLFKLLARTLNQGQKYQQVTYIRWLEAHLADVQNK